MIVGALRSVSRFRPQMVITALIWRALEQRVPSGRGGFVGCGRAATCANQDALSWCARRVAVAVLQVGVFEKRESVVDVIGVVDLAEVHERARFAVN
jgi:hypothetical protein